MSVYWVIRRGTDGLLVDWQESMNYPADLESLLVEKATNYGGTMDDYALVEITEGQFGFILNSLPARVYMNNGQLSADDPIELTYNGGYLAGTFTGQTAVNVTVYDGRGNVIAAKETALVDGAYSEYVIVPVGYKVVVIGGNEPKPRGEMVL